jgi:WD40 repeat protein
MTVCFSSTGRFLFSSYDDNLVEVWDLLDATHTEPSATSATSVTYFQPSFSLPREHTGAISMVDVNSSGQALATSSADHSVKIWA